MISAPEGGRLPITNDPAKPDDFDPAAPAAAEAARAANFGGSANLVESGAPPHPSGTPATLPFDADAADAFLASCTNSQPRVSYGLGKKVPFHGAEPGCDFTQVDCSGFVRELIFRATTPAFDFPDGSVVQHEWVRDQGFAHSSVADAVSQDGLVRIAFLSPQSTSSHIGHVVVIHNGRTLESHGDHKVGPDSRPWTGQDWQAKTTVFLLTGL